MTRKILIERIRRAIYGEQPSDDAQITIGLVNQWLNDGLAVAAKQSYKEAIQIDGIGYVNNSFYTTFKNIAVTKDENFLYKVALPQLPLGIGRNEGMSIKFKDSDGNISIDAVPLTENQKTYFKNMRPIPNRILYYSEGDSAYACTSLPLTNYTAYVTMISGGDSSDMDSTINVPDDSIPVVIAYVNAQLMFQRNQVQDTTNDGKDIK